MEALPGTADTAGAALPGVAETPPLPQQQQHEPAPDTLPAAGVELDEAFANCGVSIDVLVRALRDERMQRPMCELQFVSTGLVVWCRSRHAAAPVSTRRPSH